MRKLLIVSAALLLSGCITANWTPEQKAQFIRDQAAWQAAHPQPLVTPPPPPAQQVHCFTTYSGTTAYTTCQ